MRILYRMQVSRILYRMQVSSRRYAMYRAVAGHQLQALGQQPLVDLVPSAVVAIHPIDYQRRFEQLGFAVAGVTACADPRAGALELAPAQAKLLLPRKILKKKSRFADFALISGFFVKNG